MEKTNDESLSIYPVARDFTEELFSTWKEIYPDLEAAQNLSLNGGRKEEILPLVAEVIDSEIRHSLRYGRGKFSFIKQVLKPVGEILGNEDISEFLVKNDFEYILHLFFYNIYHTARVALEEEDKSFDREIARFARDIRRDFDADINEYHQLPCSPRTSARRAELLARRHPEKEKRVLFLGDDDVVSVCLAFYLKKHHPERNWKIDVLEIDDQVLNFIQRGKEKENLEVDQQKRDLLHKVPSEYRQGYDIVFTDPSYLPHWSRLFTTRAGECLKDHRASRLYLTISHPHLTGWKEEFFQFARIKLHLELLDHFEAFSEYPVPNMRSGLWKYLIGAMVNPPPELIPIYPRIPFSFSNLWVLAPIERD